MVDGKVYQICQLLQCNKNKIDNEFQNIKDKQNNYIEQLQSIIPPISYGISEKKISIYESLIRSIPNYYFDNSEEAVKYRKEIALKPWTEEVEDYSPFMEQIEKITGVKLLIPPPSQESAIRRMAEIFKIPIEMLIMKNRKIYLIDTISLNIYGEKKTDKYNKKIINGGLYIEQLKEFLPLYTDELSLEHKNAIKNYFSNYIGSYDNYYNFSNSCIEKQYRKDTALKNWNEF